MLFPILNRQKNEISVAFWEEGQVKKQWREFPATGGPTDAIKIWDLSVISDHL